MTDPAPISVAPTTKKRLGRPPKRPAPPVEATAEEDTRRPMREDDSRAAAAKRAAEILGNFDGTEFDFIDEFATPKAPDGWEYEWKCKTVYNKEDPGRWQAYQKTGWTEVPYKRHPNMMPLDYKGTIIERKGMVMMERPAEISRRFRERDRAAARDQMRTKQDQLTQAPQGQFERKNKDSSLVRLGKSYEPMPVPEDTK